MKKFLYESVFANGSYQFCGHVDEYLIAHVRHLGLYYTETRFGQKNHCVRIYEEGRLVSERQMRSAHNIFVYYFLFCLYHNIELWRFAARQKGRTIVLSGHPVTLFGMAFQKLFHKLIYVYWIGDYFPSRSLVIRAFERVKKFYHDRVDFRCYLSDAINRVMNGTVRNEPSRRTIAWGLRIYPGCEIDRSGLRQLLFVGLLRNGQGIDAVLDFIAANPGYQLAIIGEAAAGYDREVRRFIDERKIGDRVFFPNRFYAQDELLAEAKKSFAGIALYDVSADNFTHYADPGKVKAYIEMGLPVIMTRISDVVKKIEEFHAGEIVDSVKDVGEAACRIVADGESCRRGVLAMAAHFDYERYYAESFAVLEEDRK